MKVYYMTAENRKSEQERLLKELNAESTYTLKEATIEQKEKAVERYQYELGRSIYEKNRKVRSIFSFGKPRMTYILLYINIVIFFLIELNGGSMNPENLILFGAKYNRSEEHTSELQSRGHLVCRLLLEKKENR